MGFGVSFLRVYVLVCISFSVLFFPWFYLLSLPFQLILHPLPKPLKPWTIWRILKRKVKSEHFYMLKCNENKGGLGLCLMDCQAHTEHCAFCWMCSLRFLCPLPWTWRGYQTSFCSININCTLGTVLHLYYGSFWSNFSPKPASQRNFLRFWWKQMDRLRSDEDVLIITSLWTILMVVLCSFWHLFYVILMIALLTSLVGECASAVVCCGHWLD